jgi:hypothetical protein
MRRKVSNFYVIQDEATQLLGVKSWRLWQKFYSDVLVLLGSDSTVSGCHHENSLLLFATVELKNCRDSRVVGQIENLFDNFVFRSVEKM